MRGPRLTVLAALVGVLVVLLFPADSSALRAVFVALTPTGPSPSVLNLPSGLYPVWTNQDTVPHSVVFANGLCSFPVTAQLWHRCAGAEYAGTYAYTVDGKFAGTVITTPYRRSVTLSARTRAVPRQARLTLHGRVVQSNTGAAPPPPVVVLARPDSALPFEYVATVRTKGDHRSTYAWKLDVVPPNVTTTYIAEVTTQRLCYFPASQCSHPQGQVWVNAKSRPFTVRIRGSR